MSRDHVADTRTAYGDSADRFATAVGTAISSDFEAPLDVSMLRTLVDLTRSVGGPLLDAGCGTGRVARMAKDAGLDVIGVDVADGMLEHARRAHPDIEFLSGELADLPIAARSCGGIALWYSIITTPPDELPTIWSEVRRTLAPGGCVVVAFQCGSGEGSVRDNAFGTSADLTLFRHDPSVVESGLEAIGLSVHTVARRRPMFDHETTDQAFVLAIDERDER